MAKQEAFLQFLKAARSLADRGVNKNAIIQFAKNEFGEITELFKKQIDNIFKPKNGIENINLKDPNFDNTIVKMQFDDSGVPFNPKDPLKTKSLTYEEATAKEAARAAADEDYIMKVFDPEDFSDGGRAGYYGGGPAMVGDDLSDVGHGSDALMARNMQIAPGGQATTSTGLNYLLGQDNDTVRVPYKDAGPVVLPKPKPSNDFQSLLKIYNTYKDSMPGVSEDTQKYLAQDFIDKLNEKGLSQTQFQTLRMQNHYEESRADGGRIGFRGGGADMGDEDKAEERTSRGYGTAPDTGSRRGTNDYSTTTQTQNHDRAMRDNQQPPESNYEKTIGTIQKANDFNKVYQVAKAGSLKPLLAINPYAIGITGLIALDKRRKRKQAYEDSLLEEETLMPFADGGRIGYNKGKAVKPVIDEGRRGFMKAAGATTAGIAALKTGMLGFADKAAPVVEKVAEAAGQAPTYFLKLVAKIKALGDDVTQVLAYKDKQKVTKYKDFELTEDLTTGKQEIQRMKVLDDDSGSYYGQNLTEETYMSYKPGKSLADETTGPIPDEYEEGTAYLRSDREYAGDVVDEMSGVSDDIYEEVGEVVPEAIRKEKADGGRIGYNKGKKVVPVVKEGLETLIKKVNKLFGKDTLTTADKLPIPQKTLDRNLFSEANKRLNKSTTPESEKIVGDILEDTDINDLFDADGKLNKDAVLKAAVSKDVKSKSIIPKDEYMEYSKDFDKEILGKYSPENAVDDIFPSGDYKYDADMAAEAYVENNPQMFNDMLYDDLDDKARSEVYSKVLDVISQRNAKMLKMKRNAKSIDISDDAVADDFTNFIKKTDPEGFKELEQKLLLENAKNPKNRKLNATGGLASMLGE